MAAKKRKDEGYPRRMKVRLRVIEGGLANTEEPSKTDHRSQLDPSEDAVIEQQALLKLLDTRLNLMVQDRSRARIARDANCSVGSLNTILEGRAIRPSLLTILRLARVCRIRITGLDMVSRKR